MKLFEFEWLTGCANDYFVAYCKANHIDYYYNLQRLCADIYGVGIMFNFDYQHISGNTFQSIATPIEEVQA